jgi:hypothetical protein
MVLISIHPFALRKIFLVLGALLCLTALCFADPVLMAQHYAAPVSDAATRADGEALTDLKRVDFPSRGQGLLPSKESIDQSLLQPESLFRDREASTAFDESV